MAILSLRRDYGDNISIVRVDASTSTLTQVAVTGYVLAQEANIVAANNGPFSWQVSDMCLIYCSNGWVFANISSDFESFIPMVFSTTVVGAPVVVGDFAVFASTGGNIEDLGYLPSDASKTKVVMAGSAVVANNIAHFVDTSGTIDDTAAAVTNMGNIYAGASGTAGLLRSYPAAATSGYLALQAANSAGDYAAIITNASLGQASTWTLADPASATSKILQAAGSLVSGNVLATSGTAGLAVDSSFPIIGLKYASVAITSAEFKGMYAAPKLLIAAPGANQQIIVDQLQLVMTFVSAAYANGGVVAAQYDNTVHGAGIYATNSEAAADFFAAASATFAFNGTSGNTVGVLPFTTTVNKGLYLSNLTGAFDTGDSTFVAKIWYRIIPTV